MSFVNCVKDMLKQRGHVIQKAWRPGLLAEAHDNEGVEGIVWGWCCMDAEIFVLNCFNQITITLS